MNRIAQNEKTATHSMHLRPLSLPTLDIKTTVSACSAQRNTSFWARVQMLQKTSLRARAECESAFFGAPRACRASPMGSIGAEFPRGGETGKMPRFYEPSSGSNQEFA